MAPGLSRLAASAPDQPYPFGRYYLLGLVGRGGMAEVYRAVDPDQPQRLVAIKCMRPRLAQKRRFVDMFVSEGELALRLSHENIVHTLALGRSGGRHFMVMEYIGGRDLGQLLRRCQEAGLRIPVPHALYIAWAVCRGLHYAHTRTDDQGQLLNIVNRDVSPSNVRLSWGGDVKLLDFGIAQGTLKFRSEIGVLKGKLAYMSPEQVRGMPLDSRTDIFSAGILLHEMLTTEKLFFGDSEFDLMERVRAADVAAPSKFNRRVKAELDEVVLRALAREPSERFATCGELAEALEAQLLAYQFQPTELRDFLRRTFPAEHQRERETVAECLAADLDQAPLSAESEPEEAVQKETVEPGQDLSPGHSPTPRRAPPPRTNPLVWVLLAAAIAIAVTALVLWGYQSLTR